MLGGNFSEAFFGKMHPLSIVGGKFYFISALDSVGSFISARTGKEQQKMGLNNNVVKYTANYTKKRKHKKGGRK